VTDDVRGTLAGTLGDYLREQRTAARLTLRQLAERAEVSNPYLSQVERGLRRPSAQVLNQIARGLEVSAEALYVRAGLLAPDPEDPGGGGGDRSVPAALRSDPHLHDRHRVLLLDLYSALRREAAAEATAAAGVAAAAVTTTGAAAAAVRAAVTRAGVTRAAVSVDARLHDRHELHDPDQHDTDQRTETDLGADSTTTRPGSATTDRRGAPHTGRTA